MAAVEPRQAQQIRRDAREPVGLALDVRHELARHLGGHVLRLEDGVRHQADARQRRFQLVARIRHKAPPGALRRLEPVGQAVELRRNLGDLVAAAHGGAVAVGALAHLADGLQQVADAPRQHAREQIAQRHDQRRDRCRDFHQRRLEVAQHPGLHGVVLIGADRADRLVAVHDGRGAAAEKRRAVIARGERIVPLQRLLDLRIEGVAADGALRLARVIEHAPGGVGHENARNARLLQTVKRLTHALLRKPVEPREGRLHHLHARRNARLLRAEDEILRGQQRIGVQDHQYHHDDQNIAQAELNLQAGFPL